jgi:hypothetical protein
MLMLTVEPTSLRCLSEVEASVFLRIAKLGGVGAWVEHLSLSPISCLIIDYVVGVFSPLIGVWTAETIPVRTCFGPLIGQQSHSMEVAEWTDKAANHIWKVSVGKAFITFGCFYYGTVV